MKEIRELNFKEIVDQSSISKVLNEMSDATVEIDAEINVGDAKKQMSALLDQFQYQIKATQSSMDDFSVSPSLFPKLTEKRKTERAKNEAETRVATTGSLRQIGGSMSKLVGTDALSDEKDRINLIKEIKKQVERLQTRNRRGADGNRLIRKYVDKGQKKTGFIRTQNDTVFQKSLDALEGQINNVLASQKKGDVKVAEIEKIITEVDRLSERFKAK